MWILIMHKKTTKKSNLLNFNKHNVTKDNTGHWRCTSGWRWSQRRGMQECFCSSCSPMPYAKHSNDPFIIKHLTLTVILGTEHHNIVLLYVFIQINGTNSFVFSSLLYSVLFKYLPWANTYRTLTNSNGFPLR